VAGAAGCLAAAGSARADSALAALSPAAAATSAVAPAIHASRRREPCPVSAVSVKSGSRCLRCGYPPGHCGPGGGHHTDDLAPESWLAALAEHRYERRDSASALIDAP